MMGRFEHGGDIYAHPSVIDFSASLNPLGMPESARRALRDCASACEVYPDPHCRELRSAVAAYEGVSPENVLCCAGATDAIARTCEILRPVQALVLAPCYSGYEQALSKVGSTVKQYRLKEANGFAVTEEVIEAVIETACDVDVLFIANPNNPTGAAVSRTLLERIVERCRAADTSVVLDECFRAFTDEPGMASELERFGNLVVVGALTKTHALAGLRVGYLMSADARFLASAAEAGQEWAVSTPAQLAGVAALEDETYLVHTREYIDHARAQLIGSLVDLGLHVIPSQANYVLARCGTPLAAPLLERGILARDCGNFPGLDSHWIRFAVRTVEENDALSRALEEVLA